MLGRLWDWLYAHDKLIEFIAALITLALFLGFPTIPELKKRLFKPDSDNDTRPVSSGEKVLKSFLVVALVLSIVALLIIHIGKGKEENPHPTPEPTAVPTTAAPTTESPYDGYFDPNKEYSVGDTFLFGKFEQDGITNNGPELIEWQVLDVGDENLLALSRSGLEYRAYQTGETSCWDNSELRQYLINDFYNSVFSEQEKQFIINSLNDNSGTNYNGIDMGDDTYDYVFCLSVNEVYKYFPKETPEDWKSRMCEPTVFAKKKYNIAKGSDPGAWWLRTPGVNKSYVAIVRGNKPTKGEQGAVLEYGYLEYGSNVLVRPAIRLVNFAVR